MTVKTSTGGARGRSRSSRSGSSPRPSRRSWRPRRRGPGARPAGGGSPRAGQRGLVASVPSSSTGASGRSCARVGPDERTSTRPTTMIPAAAIHGTTRASVSSSLPAKSGRRRAGPVRRRKGRRRGRRRSRARRAGGTCRPPRPGRAGSFPAPPTSANPAPRAPPTRPRSRAPSPHTRGSRRAAAREHRDSADTVHQPSRRECSERSGGEEDRRPEAQDPSMSVTSTSVTVATATAS